MSFESPVLILCGSDATVNVTPSALKVTAVEQAKHSDEWENIPKPRLYEVARIIGGLLSVRSGCYYLVKWKHYPLDHSTGEKECDLGLAHDALKKFWKSHGKPSYNDPKILSPEGEDIEEEREQEMKDREEELYGEEESGMDA